MKTSVITLGVVLAIGVYVIFAPFNPIVFLSLGIVLMGIVVWAIGRLLRIHNVASENEKNL